MVSKLFLDLSATIIILLILYNILNDCIPLYKNILCKTKKKNLAQPIIEEHSIEKYII